MTDVLLADTADAGNEADAMTIVRSHNPPRVGKRYDLIDGQIVKHQIANITHGEAQSWLASTAEQMADILRGVTSRVDSVLCPALWHGDSGEPFTVTTEHQLSDLLGHAVGSPELAGVHLTPQGLIAARLRRGLTSSTWILLDADNPPGIPAEWAAMTAAERLGAWDDLLPGLNLCERIELRGSSARVLAPGQEPGGATHIWLRISNPEMLAVLKAYLGVHMVLSGCSFQSPRFSRVDGRVIGHSHRSLFDLSVLDAGRLVFCAQPEISESMIAAGYRVVDADVRIVNAGAGAFDISYLTMPTAEDLADYAGHTGERVTFGADTGALAIASRGLLTLDTEIESRGQVRTFRDWLSVMAVDGLLRCEAPFRASVSEAAFIRKTGHEAGFIHDIGNNTTYTLDPDMARNADVAELGARLAAVLPPETVAAAVAEREPQRVADAVATETSVLQAEGERETVICEEGLEHHVMDRMLAELPNLKTPVFRHSGGLVYVSKSREVRSFDLAGVSSLVRTIGMERAGRGWIAAELSRNLAFMKTKNRRLRVVDVPKPVVQMMTETTMDTVPTISGIISTPTMRPDGSLMLTNGFDMATGFWLDHDLTVSVPETPTKDDAMDAFNTLLELLEGFPMDTMSETVAVATMMGAVLRPAFPTMPGLMIEAPTAGAGKSYLTKVIGYLAHGRVPAVSNWPKGEEFAKHLHSMLVAGVPFIGYDNANGVEVGGETICTMLTEPEIRVRILGETSQVLVPTAGVVLVVNGNHPRITEDATQRFISCYINPTQANPRERAFTSDPLELLRADRGRYVGACLTIARAYLAARSPGAVGYGSFERWSRLVRSSLVWLVGEDVLTTTRAAMEDDPELQRIVSVVGLIAGAVGLDVDFKLAGLLAAIQERDAMQLAVLGSLVGATAPGAALPPESAIRDKAGRFFRDRMRDRVVTVEHAGNMVDVRLSREGVSVGVVKWRLKLVRTIGPAPVEPVSG